MSDMIATTEAVPLLRASGIAKSFPKPDGQQLLVLEDVNLQLAEGQIVGLLGRSGSGKSTLLRVIAGLSAPSRGEMIYMGRPVEGPAAGDYHRIALGIATMSVFVVAINRALWRPLYYYAERHFRLD